MAVTPFYIPSPSQTPAQIAARIAALGVTLGSLNVPPSYAAAVAAGGGVPGVAAEYGSGPTVVFLNDNGSIGPTDVANLIAPLNAQASAAAASQATAAAVVSAIQSQMSTIQTWIAANPSGAVLNAAQTLVLAEMLNGIGAVLLQLIGAEQITSSVGT